MQSWSQTLGDGAIDACARGESRVYLERAGSVLTPVRVVPRLATEAGLGQCADWLRRAGAAATRMEVLKSESTNAACARSFSDEPKVGQHGGFSDGWCYTRLFEDRDSVGLREKLAEWPTIVQVVEAAVEYAMRPDHELARVAVRIVDGCVHVGVEDGPIDALSLVKTVRVAWAAGELGMFEKMRVGGMGGSLPAGVAPSASGRVTDRRIGLGSVFPSLGRTDRSGYCGEVGNQDDDGSDDGGVSRLCEEISGLPFDEVGVPGLEPAGLSDKASERAAAEAEAVTRVREAYAYPGSLTDCAAVARLHVAGRCCWVETLSQVVGPDVCAGASSLGEVLARSSYQRAVGVLKATEVVVWRQPDGCVHVLPVKGANSVSWVPSACVRTARGETLVRVPLADLPHVLGADPQGCWTGSHGPGLVDNARVLQRKEFCDRCGFVVVIDGHAARCRPRPVVTEAQSEAAWLGDAVQVCDVRTAMLLAGVPLSVAGQRIAAYVSGEAQAQWVVEHLPRCAHLYGTTVGTRSGWFEAHYDTKLRNAYLAWLWREFRLPPLGQAAERRGGNRRASAVPGDTVSVGGLDRTCGGGLGLLGSTEAASPARQGVSPVAWMCVFEVLEGDTGAVVKCNLGECAGRAFRAVDRDVGALLAHMGTHGLGFHEAYSATTAGGFLTFEWSPESFSETHVRAAEGPPAGAFVGFRYVDPRCSGQPVAGVTVDGGGYKCGVVDCKKRDTLWLSADNFSNHVLARHGWKRQAVDRRTGTCVFSGAL